MFISTAFAQSAAPAGGATAGIESFLPLILIFVVFYFMLIRPQQKRMKQHKEMLGNLRRGDRVVTSGGILGTVTKIVTDTEVAVEIAEGVRVRVLKSTISEVLNKTEPVPAKAAKEAKGPKDAPVKDAPVKDVKDVKDAAAKDASESEAAKPADDK